MLQKEKKKSSRLLEDVLAKQAELPASRYISLPFPFPLVLPAPWILLSMQIMRTLLNQLTHTAIGKTETQQIKLPAPHVGIAFRRT